MNSLKKQGLWDDTIIVFTSDHGYHLDHLSGVKSHFLISEQKFLPCTVTRHIQIGTTSEAMVELIDIYPTLADLAGLEAPNHLRVPPSDPSTRQPRKTG